MGILDSLGLSSSSANKMAKKAAQAQQAGYGTASTLGKKYYKTATGAIGTGVTQATGALAPAILNAGDLANRYSGANAVNLSSYGIGDPSLAANAFANYVKPGYELGRQSILRTDTGLGSGRSGGTEADLQDYAFNQYNNWQKGLTQFDPLQAAELQGNLGIAQGNIYTGGAQQLAGLATGQGTQQGQYAIGSANALANQYNQQAANNAAVAGNWGNLAGQVLGAGTKLFGMYGPTPNPTKISFA